jgi:AraC-like DNA-binding protein
MRRTDSAAVLHLYADLIVHYLQRELGKENTVATELERVWNEVQHHIARKWTVTELALQVGMSRSCFHRIVLEQTGSTPMQVVQTMRMERACTMLLYTDYTLGSIAEAVGYEDQFAFSKAFKRYAGTSPGQFREQQKTPGR